MTTRLVGLAQSLGDVVQAEIRDHEDRLHTSRPLRPGVPPPNRRRLTSIPYPDYEVDDALLARAVELLTEGQDLGQVAHSLEIPTPALERHLAEYRGRFGHFLWQRATAR